MAIPILIIGKSGSGKSASMRNLDPDRVALINVLGKPLPFRGKFMQVVTDDYAKVTARLSYFAENLGRMFSRPELPPSEHNEPGED